MNFSDKVKFVRNKLGLSQTDLAAHLGSSYAMINRWEGGLVQPSKSKIQMFEKFCAEKGIIFPEKDLITGGVRLINQAQIKAWIGENSIKVQTLIPELIDKLLAESGVAADEKITLLDDSTNSPGPDARTKVDRYIPFVPKGDTIWEIGSTVSMDNAANKFNEDICKYKYNKIVKRKTNFVFVCPAKIPLREKLENKYKEEWKSVHVIDGIILEKWLEICPTTSMWLLGIMHKIKLNCETIDQAWGKIESLTEPKITKSLFLFEREEEKNKLLQLIKEGVNANVYAPTIFEANSFAVSSLSDNELSNRAIVINDLDTFNLFTNNYTNKIFILNFEIDQLYLDRKNTYILLYSDTYHFINDKKDLLLRNRPNYKILSILENDMHVEKNKIESLRVNNNLKFIIEELKSEQFISDGRIVPDDKIIKLAPLLFVGRININSEKELNILNVFLDNENTDSYCYFLKSYSKEKESLVVEKDGFYSILEKEYIWNKQYYVLNVLFNKFIEQVRYIFGLSKCFGKSLTGREKFQLDIGGKICEELLNSLILFSIYKSDLKHELNKFVDDLFSLFKKNNRYHDLSKLLLSLSQISQHAFIENIKLMIEDNSIDLFFDNNEIKYQDDYCSLLVSLETLCQYEESVYDALKILWSLSSKPYKYYFSNSPENSLKSLLHWSNERTCLTLAKKTNYIKKVISDSVDSRQIDLILSSLFLDHYFVNSVGLLKKPHNIIEKKTNEEAIEFINEIILFIIDNKKISIESFLDVWRHYRCLELNTILALNNYAKTNYRVDTDEGKKIYNHFIEFRYDLYRFEKPELNTIIDLVNTLIKHFKPTDYFESNIIYFLNTGLNRCPNVEFVSISYEDEENKVLKFRKKLVNDFIQIYGLNETIIKLISIVPDEKYQAGYLEELFVSEDSIRALFETCLKYNKLFLLSLIIDNNIIISEKIILSMNDKELNQVLPALSSVYKFPLSEKILRNEHNIKKVFENRITMGTNCCFEMDYFRIFNPIRYLEMNYYRNKENIDKNAFLDVLLNLEEKYITTNTHFIKELINWLDETLDDERIFQIEKKYENLYSYDGFPEKYKNYYFLNPRSLISRILDEKDPMVFRLHFWFSLPANFFLYEEALNNFANEFVKTSKYDKEHSDFLLGALGNILGRSADITQETSEAIYVRNILEKLSNKVVNLNYCTGIENTRGLRTVGDGSDRFAAARRLDSLANEINITYQESSKIIRMLAESYRQEGKMDEMHYLKREKLI